MSITIINLIPAIRVETGDEDSTNQKWTDVQYRDNKIPQGLKDMSARWVHEYDVTGAGDTQTIDPTPATDELPDVKALIVLCTALVTLRGERANAARNSYTYSNPAGRTDLSKIPKNYSEAIIDLEKRIEAIVTRKSRARVEGEIDSAGSELRSSRASDKTYVEGLPVTTITTEV